jgi:hypothetical protein
MKTATLIVFVAVLACRFSVAQTPAEQEVLQFERDACKAFLDADVAALERVLTPEFTLTLSNGEVVPRARIASKTKCRMSILAIRHPALQSMCSKD